MSVFLHHSVDDATTYCLGFIHWLSLCAISPYVKLTPPRHLFYNNYSGIFFYMSERYCNFWSIFLVMHRFVKSFTFLVTEIWICFTCHIQGVDFLNLLSEWSKKTFQQRHSSTWEISLPFLFTCLLTFLIYLFCLFFLNVFYMFISFICMFFSIFWGPNLSNLKKIFCLLESNRLFSLFTSHYCLSLSLLYVSYLLQDWTLRIRATCKIQTSTLFQ